MSIFKQIFSAFLLFALAAAAQGQTGYARFEVDSGSIIGPGRTITIHLLSDMTCSGWYIDGVAELNASGNQAILAYGGTAGNLRVDAANVISDSNTSVWADGTIYNYNGSLFSVLYGTFFGGLPAGYPIISFDYTINSQWDGSGIMIGPLAEGKSFNWSPGETYHVDASTAYIHTYSNVVIQPVTISAASQVQYAGDLNGDNLVDYKDVSIMASQWLQTPGEPSADIAPPANGDNFVNLQDFAMLAQNFTGND